MTAHSREFLVMFDIDGVLVDSRQNLLNSYIYTCSEFNIQADPTKFFALIGRELSSIFLELHNEASNELLTTFKSHSALDGQSLSAFPGGPELVKQLEESGLSVCCVTSKDEQRAQLALAASGYPKLRVFSPSQGFASKPRPDLIFAALDELGKASGVYLGDTVWDFEAASAAGVPFIFCEWGYGDITASTLSAPTFELAGNMILEFAGI